MMQLIKIMWQNICVNYMGNYVNAEMQNNFSINFSINCRKHAENFENKNLEDL